MRKQYSASFKARVVRELLREEKTVAQLAAEYGVHPTQLGKWKALALQSLPTLFEGQAEAAALKAAHEAERTALYAEVGRLTTQVAWLKRKLGLAPD